VLLVAGCGGKPGGGVLQGFDEAEVIVGGQAWNVAVADDAGERSQGLMGVEDLGDLDGMLFVYATDTDTSFWMKNTLIPLDVAFFDAAGGLVDLVHMEPCAGDPCSIYRAAGLYRYALEVPAGGFGGVEDLLLGVPLPD